MQLDPKERLGYAVVAVLIAAIAGVFGYRYAHKPASDVVGPVTAVLANQTPTAAVVVHVVGAVKKPGVYSLPAESRAEDAVKAAGGALPQADLESINLAAKLSDGQQIRISVKGEAPAPSQNGESRGHGGKITSGTVSLNSGSAEDLQTVPGIGPATAQKIVSWRSAHGSFSKIEDLKQVGGIGDKKLQTMRPFLRL